MTSEAAIRLAGEIGRRGPVPFAELVELALYDPDGGFYETGGVAGRRGDFITSPEVGPLFGAVLARALDAWWTEAGEPDPFVVVDAGAGAGTLAVAVLAASPRCAPALRYVLVERSAALRERHRAHLPLHEASQAFVPTGDRPDVDGHVAPITGRGPIVVSLAALPRLEGPAVVMANELLDNLPFSLAEHGDGQWYDVRVTLAPDDASGFREVLVPLDPADADLLGRLVPAAPEGSRVPLQHEATAWLRDALAVAGDGGRVVAFDYASTTTAELAHRPWLDWLRTYRAHGRGTHPLDALGDQDITCEVAIDQLAACRVPVVDRSQAEFLVAHGIDDLVDDGRRIWEERAHLGDLEAVRARSRVTEAAALTDPSGLGAFRVLEW
jgi:SAM-dependent MidA family methyltransferase